MARARSNRSRYAREKGERFDPTVVFDLAAGARRRRKTPLGMVPRYYFTKHSVEKIGVKPIPGYVTTPLGVYAYPLTEEYLDMLMQGALPYMQHAPFLTVLELVEPQLCLFVGKPEGQAVYEEAKRQLKALPRMSSQKRPLALRGLLLAQGYTSVYDNGTSTIHENEPDQMCFLTPGAYKVVATMEQASLYRAWAPDTGEAIRQLMLSARQWGLAPPKLERDGKGFSFQSGDVSGTIRVGGRRGDVLLHVYDFDPWEPRREELRHFKQFMGFADWLRRSQGFQVEVERGVWKTLLSALTTYLYDVVVYPSSVHFKRLWGTSLKSVRAPRLDRRRGRRPPILLGAANVIGGEGNTVARIVMYQQPTVEKHIGQALSNVQVLLQIWEGARGTADEPVLRKILSGMRELLPVAVHVDEYRVLGRPPAAAKRRRKKSKSKSKSKSKNLVAFIAKLKKGTS